jgi:hypothetical protein
LKFMPLQCLANFSIHNMALNAPKRVKPWAFEAACLEPDPMDVASFDP